RNEYFAGDRKREVFERVQRIAADLGVSLEAMPEIALRFTLSHPAVSTVIPGMRTVRHVELNCAAGDGKGLPAAQLEALRQHRWIRASSGGTVRPLGLAAAAGPSGPGAGRHSRGAGPGSAPPPRGWPGWRRRPAPRFPGRWPPEAGA